MSATAPAVTQEPPGQLSEPWSTAGSPENRDLVDQEWIPSDHSSSSKGAASEIGDGSSDTTREPPGEARRQLGQVFPHHLPADAPGGDEAVSAAQDALEQDVGSTPLGEGMQHVAALVLTPEPAPEPGVGLQELRSVDVVVQVQIHTRMGTEELRIYRVALTRDTTSKPWRPHTISII